MAKPITVGPATGVLDLRTPPDLLPREAMRYRQNFQADDQGKLVRGCGWTKLLTQSLYNNADFHDQLLTFTSSTREPVTMLTEAVSAQGIRSLILATQSRVARLIETTANWKILGSGFGGEAGVDCSGPRFKSAVIGDYLLLTNNFDRVQYHRLEQPPFDSTLMAPIPDLETIGLTKAGAIWQWKDVAFLGDVEMDGLRYPNRIVWGDYKNPLSFDPAKPESVAGFKDLNYGERVLAGGPTPANTFLIYTTMGIWELSIVNGQFNWTEKYPGRRADLMGVMKYENSLVDIGGEHYYMAKDGIYKMSPYVQSPERVEWLHRATRALYETIDDTACEVQIGWFHDGEAFWSVKRVADMGCPGITLRVETQYKVADIIDHGFTAACNFRSQPIPNIRDFIIDNKICTAEQLQDDGYGWDKEGLPAPAQIPTAAFVPTVFLTHETIDVDGVTTEDPEGEQAEDSLCALLDGLRLDEFCRECERPSILVLASAQDWCLKQYDGGFYRERCTNPTATGSTGDIGYASSVGTYTLDGYDSILRPAPMFGPKAMVIFERFKLNIIPANSGEPALLQLRVGVAGQTADPNDDNCLIVWYDCTTRLLKCVTKLTAAQHKLRFSSPSQPIEWQMWRKGRIICLEFKISGTGGDCALSGLEVDARLEDTHNF